MRILAVLVLAILGNEDPAAYGACIVPEPVVALAFPSAYPCRPVRPQCPRRSALAFPGGASSSQLLSQALLTSWPVLLSLTGGSAADVTILFTDLALFRRPTPSRSVLCRSSPVN